MTPFEQKSEDKFNTLPDQWEKALALELKTDIQSKIFKILPEGKPWPILSTKSVGAFISSQEKWKRASQTYVSYTESLEEMLKEDLASGVLIFFFFSDFLTQEIWQKIKKSLSGSPAVEVFILGNFDPGSCPFKVHRTVDRISGAAVHEKGGHNVLELALITKRLIENHGPNELLVDLYVDSHFFQNIAKIRAARILAYKVLEELSITKTVKIIALTSFREWTLFERYSNMLRNNAAVASAFIGGADYVQSSGYQTLLELECGDKNDEHMERSRRMARNTSHILALESMLGAVDDAASGSYHLENLTQFYAEEAWNLMQKMFQEGEMLIDKACEDLKRERSLALRKRKHVLSGINDFPDVKEKLSIKPKEKFFRVAREFEELRLRAQSLKVKPKVYISLLGDLALLSARINFLKNYFEVIGFEVIEPHHSQTSPEDLKAHEDKIIVLCAKDEDYGKFSLDSIKSKEKFIAGKVELPGFLNLYAGQDIYQILNDLTLRLEGK